MSEKNGNPFSAAERMLEAAGVIAPDPDKRPKIKVVPVISQLAETVGKEMGKGPKLFLRGDVVMKIDYDANLRDLDFVPMTEGEFVTWAERYLNFGAEVERENHDGEKKKVWVPKSLQAKTAKLILLSPQFRACLPQVVRKNRVRLPVLREPAAGEKRGKVELLPHGYDEASQIYTFPSEVVIDEGWTAARACEYYHDLFVEFPLPLETVGKDGEREVRREARAIGACVAGAVTMFAEGLLPAHTLRLGYMITANMPRSGKSLLGKIFTAPVTGQAAGLPLVRNDETLKSMVDSALLTGQTAIFFDNVKGHIENHVLESLMTMPNWQGRTMHTQRVFTVRNESTVFISGNNATVSPDLNGRFVWIELKSEEADPNAVKHSRELDDRWIMRPENRSDLLSAAWALVRHWDAQGRPVAPTPLAGFRAWCDVVGGIVCAAEEVSGGRIGNPLVQPEMASAGDNETKHMKRLVRALLVEDMRRRLGEAMGEDVSELEDGRVIAAVRARGITVSQTAKFLPCDVARVAMLNGLFDWFLPDLPEGKDAKDVLKRPEQVKLGKIVMARSGEFPKGMKYTLTVDAGPELWRLSYEGEGRHRGHLLHCS